MPIRLASPRQSKRSVGITPSNPPPPIIKILVFQADVAGRSTLKLMVEVGDETILPLRTQRAGRPELSGSKRRALRTAPLGIGFGEKLSHCFLKAAGSCVAAITGARRTARLRITIIRTPRSSQATIGF